MMVFKFSFECSESLQVVLCFAGLGHAFTAVGNAGASE